jgi:MFS family permease
MGQDGRMSVLRTLSNIVALILLALRSLISGGVRTSKFVGRNVLAARHRGGAGEAGMMRMFDLHAASVAGDTLIAIALAGTVFFDVPVGEARSRVALYLLVTMLPFALLAPIVGPVLDRFRHGRRYALATTMLGRAFLAYVISDHFGGWALYPAAFGILVLSRAYGVARSAAIPRVLPAGMRLSEAGARSSVFGTVAGAVAAPFGLGLAALGGPRWPLYLATVLFLLGMVAALRLPARADSQPPEVVPRLFQLPGRRHGKVLTGPLVIATLAGSAVLRAAYGFLILFLAFAIRSDDLTTGLLSWTLTDGAATALIAGALGAGTFVATAAGTTLRIHRPVLLQAGSLLVVAVAAVAAVVGYNLLTVAVLCLAVAVASGLAKLAVDAVIQERLPEQVRASAFGHSETLLMLAWVAGGAVGLIPLDGRIGLAVLAGYLALALARAVFLTGRLRRERLNGAPPADEPRTVDLAAETVDVPARPAPTRTPEPARTPAQTKTPEPAKRPGRWGSRVGASWSRKAAPGEGAPRPEAGAPPPRRGEQPRPEPANPPAERPTRTLTDPAAPPGFHLYRPSGGDRTLDLDDE